MTSYTDADDILEKMKNLKNKKESICIHDFLKL